jgi:cupin fold WbuC family metalloprotein
MESNEVFYADDITVRLKNSDFAGLKQKAGKNPRHRVRLCSHTGINDNLHEMMIVLEKNVFIPPHNHPGKCESLHVIEGVADAVVFDDNGEITQVFPLGQYGSGRVFYCRMNTSVYHTLLIRSDYFIFHETTTGPFQKGGTRNAPWSPDLSNTDACMEYLENLDTSARQFMMDNNKDD